MRILVKYNGSYHYWVDTVTMHNDNICAILVSNKGAPFSVSFDKIEVVDDSYNYEKQIEKRIAELQSESAHLQLQAEMEAKLKAVGYNPFGPGPTLNY